MTRIQALFLAGVLFSVLPLARAESLAPCESIVPLMKEADEAYQKRLNDIDARKSLELYEKAAAEDQACVDPAVKASEAAWWVADHSPSKKEKQEIFQKGIDWAKEAIRRQPQSAGAHFWLAGNYGSYGESRGVMKSLFLVKPIRKELEEVLKIDPTYDGGGAYRVLGVVDYKVPGFAGGNRKRAEEQLKKSLELGPQSPFNLYYMAEYYETMNNRDKASEFLTQLEALQPTEEGRPDWVLMMEKGKILRAKLQKS